MLDSQYEVIVKLLEKIENNLTGVLMFVCFTLVVLLLIFAIMFCSSYDKTLDRIRKDEDARIKRIVEESKRDESH